MTRFGEKLERYLSRFSLSLEDEFLKRFKPSKLLGVLFEEDVCPHSRGRICMKYGSYGHVELKIPVGGFSCSLMDADTCPMFSRGVPVVYGVKDGNYPYGSIWWGKEQVKPGEVFKRVWKWLETNKKVEKKKRRDFGS